MHIHCPSQPCATLSQYWSDNGTLPVVSNVEYHFLPGEHHVPANMILQDVFEHVIVILNSDLSLSIMLCSALWHIAR